MTNIIIFLGTGTSGGIPNVPCVTSNNPKCKVCKLSLTPEGCKNKRRNTSLLVCVDHPDGRQRNILIDCGKTFFESTVDIFVKHNIKTIDAVFISHGHTDAMLGLDDLRPWSVFQKSPIPVFCDQSTMDTISHTFPYLVNSSKATGCGYISELDFKVFDEINGPVECEGILFQPLKVEHGKYSDGTPFFSNGFRFEDISYVSDCSKIPDKARSLMEGSKTLILDTLRWTPFMSHFSYSEALSEVRNLKPQRTLLVGFCHRVDHADMEVLSKEHMAKENLDISAAFDGLRLDF
ncbi:hypothetical protein COEREDRAFT_103269 [Coemansia reversa NRRL 1564]|uniref:Metallo-beta-lactamase domain-containing protein n=1 Tax=Coemansia reversa (strain ATCC 12441 / NRRL 1564) TaxID=763665 RepID=A0A2G5B721_COERN|nr:hypothetical protein COEREDRAFT_103269 [Coemansia reversa NRRL 1564]|eukprot:PIA14843.1 hypothetical protein COEREDRAFT_103269 [Coemansia reversa NRRL 1564]